jgi:ferritin-like metal-binding protein YciE
VEDGNMSQTQQKLVQYLNEAHATEAGLIRVLQSQIAMTPRGSYRDLLEKHLEETRSHAERVRNRIEDLDGGANPLQAGIGAAETIFAQTLALWKTPFDLLRGTSGEEKILKNAKDTSAT